MENEADESLIEATIRRVAEAKAAQARANDDHADSQGSRGAEPGASGNEDAIEATIRRVAEAKAAQARANDDHSETTGSRGIEPGGSADEDAIEATIRRVAEASAAQTAAAPEPEEDQFEATIRRVAEASAAQTASATTDSVSIDDEDPIEATIRRVAAERAARDAEEPALAGDPVDAAIAHAETALAKHEVGTPETHDSPLHLVESSADASDAGDLSAGWEERVHEGRDDAATDAESDGTIPYRRPRLVEREPVAFSEAAADDINAVARLETELRDTNRRLDQMVSRVDALMATLERIVGDGGSTRDDATRPRLIVAPPTPGASNEEDWDDRPQLPRFPMGAPPRPAIIRDPSPMTATAENLVQEPDIAPEPDAPRKPSPAKLEVVPDDPAPPAPRGPKRGFDLLPKVYRITVEDKRRGVDLVPLHRALLGMEGVKDMSLLSYSNGVAIVSVETENGLDPDALNNAVSRAMAREVKVEVHNESTMVVKLAEE